MGIIEVFGKATLFPIKNYKKDHHHFQFQSMCPLDPANPLYCILHVYLDNVYKWEIGSRGNILKNCKKKVMNLFCKF